MRLIHTISRQRVAWALISALLLSCAPAWSAALPNTAATANVPAGASTAGILQATTHLLAASSGFNTNVVKLKWVNEGQWLASAAFMLYRKGPNDADFVKIAGPFKENPNAPNISVVGTDGKPRELKLSQLIATARKPIVEPVNTLPMFSPRAAKLPTSAAAFQEMRQLRTQQNTPAASRVRVMAQPPKLGPALVQYMTNLQGGFSPRALAITAPTLAPRANISAANKTPGKGAARAVELDVVEARRQLVLGSLLNPAINTALGLGYVDTQVTAGAAYTYQLRVVQANGTTSPKPVASSSITVGADPQPAQPTGLNALQYGPYNTCLRWTLDEAKNQARIIAYDLYRVVNGQKKKLNSQSLTIGMLQADNGSLFDALWYYVDTNVPVGAVSYQLVGIDGFGRTTPPATIEMIMQDWERPLAPGALAVKNGNGKAVLTWTPARKLLPDHKTVSTQHDAQASYLVFRQDLDAQKPAKSAATATPKTGTTHFSGPLSATQLKQHTSLAMQQSLLGVGAPISGKLTGVWEQVTEQPRTLAQLGGQGTAPQCTFTDATSSKDHQYRYCVMAVYEKNSLESDPGPAEDVIIPDMSKPVPPAPVQAACTPLLKPQPAGTAKFQFDRTYTKSSRVVTATNAKVRNLNLNTEQAKARATVAKPTAAATAIHKVPAVNLSNSDLGSTVTLTWKASTLTAPVRYRVYRAIASGYREQASGSSASSDNASPAVASSPYVKSLASPAAASSGKATAKPLTAKPVLLRARKYQYIKYIDPDALDPKDYVLLTETPAPRFTDRLPKSRPMYYVYKITVVNRWGVEGVGARAEVRIPGTIKPPLPEVTRAIPNSEGGVTLTWKPLEEREECTKYLVYRKYVDISALSAGLGLIFKTSSTTQSNTQPTMAALHGLAFAGGMSAAPSAATTAKLPARVSDLALSKSARLGLKTLPRLHLENAKFRTGLRDMTLKSTDYQLVGEVALDALDSDGNVRYVDLKGLQPFSWYSYTVVAVDADTWNSEASKPLLSTAWKVKCAPITNVKAQQAAHTQNDLRGPGVTLTWTLPKEKLSGMVIKRAVDTSDTFVQISGILAATAVTFTDYGIMPAHAYRYQLYALDENGNLSDPANASFTKPGP
ncbi:MAG: hypothetical protein ACYDBB_21690 [Armatimonadota bacterium]